MSAPANTIYVGTGSPVDGPGTAWSNAFHTIQGGIAASSPGDMVLVTNGVYRPTEPPEYDQWGICPPWIVISNAILVTSMNGPDVTTIDGGRVRQEGASITGNGILSGFTITGWGSVEYDGDEWETNYEWFCGVVLNSGTVSNCVITGNSGQQQGGVFCLKGTVIDCVISKNRGNMGAGVQFREGLMSGCSISENYGSGVYLFCSADDIEMVMENCLISDNYTYTSGAGAWIDLGSSPKRTSRIKLNNCIIRNNIAREVGGGIFAASAFDGLELSNCIFYGNYSECAGIWNRQGGGAVYFYFDEYRTGTLARVSNCIFEENRAVVGNNTIGFDDVTRHSSVVYQNTCFDQPSWSSSGIILGDPDFVDPANGDFRLRFNSICRDGGANSSVEADTDFAGNPRIQNGTVDIGAFEYPEDIKVDIWNDDSVVDPGSPLVELQVCTSTNVTGTMWWINGTAGTGGSFPAPGVLHETSVSVPLAFGVNVIEVYGNNSAGTAAYDAVTMTMEWHTSDSPIHYVSPDGASVWPYTTWGNAATTIQDAVDAAFEGDTVLVTNGTYRAGGRAAPGQSCTNRVCVTRGISIESVNGPGETVIVGDAAMRGVFLSDGSRLSGFTVTGCHVPLAEGASYEFGGGGVLMFFGGELFNCIISNNIAMNGGGILCCGGGLAWDCIISGNETCDGGNNPHTYGREDGNMLGGGVHIDHSGTVADCIISGNTASYEGGGIACSYGGEVANSMVVDNMADYGGGILHEFGGSTLNCLIVKNTGREAMISLNAQVMNCTIAGNHGYGVLLDGLDGFPRGVMANCIVSGNSDGAYFYNSGDKYNIYSGSLPAFIDAANGDYRLQIGSPCIDAGSNSHTPETSDLAGNTRIVNGTVDIGAYEYDATLYDSDGDSLTDEQELTLTGTSPTNTNTDGDPHTDYEEYIAGTSGTDPNDWFRITAVTNHLPGSGQASLYFESSASRLYTLLGCTNLMEAAWQPVAPARIGIGGADTMTAPNAPPQQFYKLKVELP